MTQTESVPRLSDRWIPWYFFAFFIALVLILVPMCVIAFRTNSGVVTENAYEKGLSYNKAIAAQEQQESLNWKGDVTATRAADGQTVVDLVLTDVAGRPLEGADVKTLFARPTQAGMDQKVTMTALSSGHYEAKIALPMAGVWDSTTSITIGDKNDQIAKRFVFP